MVTHKVIIWVIEIIIVMAGLFAIQLPLRRKPFRAARKLVFVLKLLLIPASAFFLMVPDISIAYKTIDLLGALYLALIGDVLGSIVEYFIRVSTESGEDSEIYVCNLKQCGLLSVLFCAAITSFSIWNATHVRMQEHQWVAEGLEQEHTFAFMSDIHAGTAQSLDNLKSVCDKINQKKPEFVILGGDVTDELTTYDDMVKTYEILGEIDAPVYFIYGNHDRQPNADYVGGRSYTDEQLTKAIEDAGITILRDDFVKVADDLVLLGREDISADDGRADWEELENPYEGEGALIVADHQPFDKDQSKKQTAALQISGHTHSGQLFPLRFIYSVAGVEPYGEYERENTLLYVSAGESGWGVPIRTEARCEWELITLHP